VPKLPHLKHRFAVSHKRNELPDSKMKKASNSVELHVAYITGKARLIMDQIIRATVEAQLFT
jgi:hypothetical protein